MKAKQTPLLDLLRAVPVDARMIYDHSPTSSISIPVGVLCDQAATHIAWLEDRLAAAQAERDALTEMLANTAGPERPPFTCWWEWAIKYKRDAKEAKAEAESLRKDAERYRWLRDPNSSTDVVVRGPIPELLAEDELDAAIDAARSKE